MRWGMAAWSVLTMVRAADPVEFAVGELTFQRPADWAWVASTSPMRKAQLKVPGPGGATGEVVFFHFGPGNAGGTAANVARWLGQFEERGSALKSKVEGSTVRGVQITHVRAEGTYLSGTPGGPKTPMKDHLLLGAIVEHTAGSVFIRLTGPASLGADTEKTFRTLVESGIP